jgi:hypothetical protein
MPNTLGLWSRWYRFDSKGIKYIRKFQIDEIPTPLHEEGYTQWKRGTGPLTHENYLKLSNKLREVHTGVPKTEQTKQLMRKAKLGVPKTMEHRKNMSLAHRKRLQRIKNETNSNTTGTQSTQLIPTY